MRTRLAWALVVVAVIAVAADVVVSAQAVALLSDTAIAVHGFPFVDAAVFGSALMGGLIVSRHDRHPIGWLLLGIGVAGSLSLLTEAYAYWVQEADGPGPAGLAGVSAWVSTLLGGQVEIAALALMFLLVPDGHLLTRRWRYVAWLTLAGAVMCMLAIVSRDPTQYVLVTAENDLGWVRSTMLSVGFLSISVGLVASVVSMLVRMRRSEGAERQQLRLIALSAALATLGLLCLIVVQAVNGGRQTWQASMPLFVAYALLPIFFAVAILRHQLYELDVVINRTAVVVAGTAFAALGYTTIVVLVGRQTSGFGLSLLVTALVALAFQPVRRRVVRWADRLAYGDRAQPYEELADFNSRLVEAPGADRLLPIVAAAAGQALAAESATATLGESSATWGRSSGANTHAVAVGDQGTISVDLPRGRRLRASDGRLLQALADQSVVAFRNVALEAELAAHVADLDRTADDLARSRARVVAADDAVRLELEAAISADVMPHLLAVAEGLREARPVEPLVDRVNAGLEALRDLTRGVFPMQLTRSGIEAALRSYPLSVDPHLSGRRFPPRVEAAVYFACTMTSPTSAVLDRSGLSLMGVSEVPQQVVDRVEAAGGSVALSGDVLSVTLPDLN